MKLRTTLMMFTAATALTATVAFAAINAQALADSYIADGYTYVEVRQGPTQTKLEAVKGSSFVEVIYSNETGAIISQETQLAGAEEMGKTGVEIKTASEDFEDVSDEDDDAAVGGDDNGDDVDEADGDDGDDGDGDDDDGDDDDGDDGDGDDDDGDDHAGNAGDGDDDASDCES